MTKRHDDIDVSGCLIQPKYCKTRATSTCNCNFSEGGCPTSNEVGYDGSEGRRDRPHISIQPRAPKNLNPALLKSLPQMNVKQKMHVHTKYGRYLEYQSRNCNTNKQQTLIHSEFSQYLNKIFWRTTFADVSHWLTVSSVVICYSLACRQK